MAFIDKNMSIDHDTKRFGNQELKGNFERFIVTTILDYKQQFMGNLHEMHSSLQT